MRAVGVWVGGAWLMGASMAVAADALYIDCGSSPEEAVLAVPAPASQFARIACTRFGHILKPATGWQWRVPGQSGSRFFPAQRTYSLPQTTGNQMFFRSVDVRELSTVQAHERWHLLEKGLPTVEAPQRALEIEAINNQRGRYTLVLFDNGWGVSCNSVCRAEMAFQVVSDQGRRLVW